MLNETKNENKDSPIYPCRDCKVVPPQGPETLQGQQYHQCLETKPTKMREILNIRTAVHLSNHGAI